MQLKDIFSASSDGVSQPSNSSLRFKQKALAASILAALAIIAFFAVEASDTKPARKAPPEAAMITLRPDGTDKDVLIARYDANFVALSRRIEEVQREAAATETRLRAIIADQKSRLETQTSEVKDLKAIAGRAGLTPRPGETPEETEARIKSLLKANADAAYISKLSSQFGSKTPGKVFHTDPARNTNEPASSIVPALPDISGGVKVPDEAHAAAQQAVSGPRLAMVTLPPPAPPTSPAPRVGPSPTLNPDTPLQVNRAAGTTVEDYLPAGSFVRGRLLTGVSDTSSSWADPNTHKVELAQGTAAFDRSAGQMTAMNVRKSDLGVSSGMQNTHTTQDANNFGTSSVATNASSLATNSGVQSVSGNGVTNSVNRDDGWSVTRNSGTSYGTNESANYGTGNSSAFGAQSSRSGNSQNQFQYSSGVGFSSDSASTINNRNTTDANESPTPQQNSEPLGQLNVTDFYQNMKSYIGTPSLQGILNSAPISLANNTKNGNNKTGNTPKSTIDSMNSNGFRVSTAPTGTTASSLADASGINFGSSTQTTYQTGNGWTFGENVGESTSVSNGIRNNLADTTNAQMAEVNGLSEGRASSESTSDQDSFTHTASTGTANRVTQDRDNSVRDLGLAMAGGDAFAALRMFNASPESRSALKSMVDQQQKGLEHVMPPPPKSVAKNRDNFIRPTRTDIENDYQASAAAVQVTSDDSVNRRHQEKRIDMPNKADFMAQTREERDMANYRLGLNIVSSSEYLQKETGIRSVLERAFGGALTYSSPQEIYNLINSQASESSELKNALTELGSISGPGMTEEQIAETFKSKH